MSRGLPLEFAADTDGGGLIPSGGFPPYLPRDPVGDGRVLVVEAGWWLRRAAYLVVVAGMAARFQQWWWR